MRLFWICAVKVSICSIYLQHPGYMVREMVSNDQSKFSVAPGNFHSYKLGQNILKLSELMVICRLTRHYILNPQWSAAFNLPNYQVWQNSNYSTQFDIICSKSYVILYVLQNLIFFHSYIFRASSTVPSGGCKFYSFKHRKRLISLKLIRSYSHSMILTRQKETARIWQFHFLVICTYYKWLNLFLLNLTH